LLLFWFLVFLCCYDAFDAFDAFDAVDVLIVFVDAFGMSVVEIAFVIALVVIKPTFVDKKHINYRGGPNFVTITLDRTNTRQFGNCTNCFNFCRMAK
jgi:hypothetical protein